jgi:hypothetical protein
MAALPFRRVGSAWSAISRFQGTIKDLKMLTPAEKSISSWAKRVRSYTDVPEAFRDFFRALPDVGSDFPYTLLMPAYRVGFLRRTKPKLVCSLGDDLYVLEQDEGQLICTCFPIAYISAIEVGRILLRAWVNLRGITREGLPACVAFEFNAVSLNLFDPILKQFRGYTEEMAGGDVEQERAKFKYLLNLNFKFMNYGRFTILAGERVTYTLLQPEISQEVVRLLGRVFFRSVSAAHLSILTDRELILIRDSEGHTWRSGIKYGSVWHYLPLNRIRGVSLTQIADDKLRLSIHLPYNERVSALFAAENAHGVKLLINYLEVCCPALEVHGTDDWTGAAPSCSVAGLL